MTNEERRAVDVRRRPLAKQTEVTRDARLRRRSLAQPDEGDRCVVDLYRRRLMCGDDRALLGRLWGLSGHDVDTAQREQRRARREVDQWLRRQQPQLEQLTDQLLASPSSQPPEV